MDLRNEIGVGKRVVFKLTGFTGEVIKWDRGGVWVFCKERLQEKEFWPWSMITQRYPRLIKRFPRPFRFPRLKPSTHCHCYKSKLEVFGDEIRCQKCGYAIGTESFWWRQDEAAELFHRRQNRGSKRKPKTRRGEVRKRADRPRKQSASRRRRHGHHKGRKKVSR